MKEMARESCSVRLSETLYTSVGYVGRHLLPHVDLGSIIISLASITTLALLPAIDACVYKERGISIIF